LEHISKLLKISTGDGSYTKEELSAITGIPTGKSSGKVVPAIHYAKYTGMIDFVRRDNKYTLNRTQLGDTIFMEDNTLSERLTQLLCHAMLVSSTGATLWNAIFKKILSQSHGEINISLLKSSVKSVLDTNIEVDLSPFNSCYQKTFSGLNLLSFDKNLLKLQPFNGGIADDDYIYVYAYVLLHEWENFYTENEITATMFDDLNFWATFGWNKSKEYAVLEQLSELGIVKFNRQLTPYTLLKLCDSQSIIDKIYSLLL
jgi:hypothetical protein